MVPAVRAADGSASLPIPIPTGLATFMTFPLGCGGVGGAGLLGHVARWALTGRRHREIKTLSLALRVSWVFYTCQSPHLHFLENNFEDGADPLWGLVQLHFWLMVRTGRN